MRVRPQHLTYTALALLLLTAGCSNNDVTEPQSSPSSSAASATETATGTPSPSVDPRAEPAVDAYTNFMAAVFEAEKHPGAIGEALPPEQDFTKYSFDPARARQVSFISLLSTRGWEYRGSPPTTRVSVTGIDLSASPYPTVTLVDCPLPSPAWGAYDVKTGKAIPTPTTTSPLPHPTTAEVINYQGRWGVHRLTPKDETCSA